MKTTVHRSAPAESGPPKEPPKPPAPPPPPRWLHILWLTGLVLALVGLFLPKPAEKTTPLAYTDWRAKIVADQVKTATIDPEGKVSGKLVDGTRYTSRLPVALKDDSLGDDLRTHRVTVDAVGNTTTLWNVVGALLPFALLFGLYFWFGRRASGQLSGRLMGFGSSRARIYDEQRPSTRFSDVAGYDGAKREIGEIVDFLKRPERYRAAGAIGPRGVLMLGPPGTGKTLLARAVAGEADVPFLALTGSSFVEMFVGVGAARVRDLFAAARKRAPAIIFIDEIDAIGGRRGGALVANDEREQTLNQLLFEMDGFDPATGVVVLAATNRPETLDPALLRPGRFDRQVEIPLPNQTERTAILAVHTRTRRLEPDVDLDAIARGTPGFSGADLANLVNEAAIVAVRNGRDRLRAEDFDEARDRVLLGRREASNALMPEEQQAVAIHEAGHALVAALSEHADPVTKVTILPRGAALGITEQLPVDERHLYSQSYLHDSLAVRLGGRAAERLVLGEASTGASNDLAGATELATRMVREYGMSERLGPVGFSGGSPMYLGAEEVRHRSYAEDTQRVIDEEVEGLLRRAEQRATTLLTDHRAALDRLVAQLLVHETLDGEAVDAAIRGAAEPTGPAETGGRVQLGVRAAATTAPPKDGC